MADVKKILCFCGCGLGTSMMMEMNVKTALEEMGIDGVEVEHSVIEDVAPGAADLFVCAEDIVNIGEKAGPTVGIKNMLDPAEYKDKLSPHFN